MSATPQLIMTVEVDLPSPLAFLPKFTFSFPPTAAIFGPYIPSPAAQALIKQISSLEALLKRMMTLFPDVTLKVKIVIGGVTVFGQTIVVPVGEVADTLLVAVNAAGAASSGILATL